MRPASVVSRPKSPAVALGRVQQQSPATCLGSRSERRKSRGDQVSIQKLTTIHETGRFRCKRRLTSRRTGDHVESVAGLLRHRLRLALVLVLNCDSILKYSGPAGESAVLPLVGPGRPAGRMRVTERAGRNRRRDQAQFLPGRLRLVSRGLEHDSEPLAPHSRRTVRRRAPFRSTGFARSGREGRPERAKRHRLGNVAPRRVQNCRTKGRAGTRPRPTQAARAAESGSFRMPSRPYRFRSHDRRRSIRLRT